MSDLKLFVFKYNNFILKVGSSFLKQLRTACIAVYGKRALVAAHYKRSGLNIALRNIFDQSTWPGKGATIRRPALNDIWDPTIPALSRKRFRATCRLITITNGAILSLLTLRALIDKRTAMHASEVDTVATLFKRPMVKRHPGFKRI